MLTVPEIIDALGGTTAAAVAIGTTQQNVTNMKARGTIPANFFKAIVHAARTKGRADITLEKLADLAANNWNRAA